MKAHREQGKQEQSVLKLYSLVNGDTNNLT